MEIFQALQQLVEIFGPGSEEMTTKLLDDLAIDPDGESRSSWDTAIGEAIEKLNELKREQSVEKGKQKGMGFLSPFCFQLSLMNSTDLGEGSSHTPDIEMGGAETSTLKRKLSTTAGEEGEQQVRQKAMDDYQIRSSHLIT